MKTVLILTISLITLSSYAQKDVAKVNFGIVTGRTNYSYDYIHTGGYSYSSQQWGDGALHSLSPEHRYVDYYGLNLSFFMGFNIPIVRTQKFSIGLYPGIAAGKVFQIVPNPNKSYDDYGWEIVDTRAIGSFGYCARVLGYARYVIPKRVGEFYDIKLFGGVAFYGYMDKYRIPMAGFEFSVNNFSVGPYVNLGRQKYYRQLSNGDLEVAKSIHEFGFTTSIYIPAKKKKKQESENSPSDE